MTVFSIIDKGKRDTFDYKEAIAYVKGELQRILRLTDREKQYVEAFKRGEYLPELLFDDTEIVKRIKFCPAALWRIQNIKSS